MKQRRYFSSCLLFAQIGTISTFFAVRIFLPVTRSAGNLAFFMSTFSTPVTSFMDWFLVYLFHSENAVFCNSIFKSVIGRNLGFIMCAFFMPVYFTHPLIPSLVYLFHTENASFCNSICRNLCFFMSNFFSRQSTFFTGWYLVTVRIFRHVTPLARK